MNELEWNRCTNAAEMILYLWSLEEPVASDYVLSVKIIVGRDDATATPHKDLNARLHRYYLASCRRIWKLLPLKASRGSVELGELWVEGKASDLWLHRYDWHSEAAAFRIDYAENDDEISDVLDAFHAIPKDELRSLLHPPEIADRIEPRELMKAAAYFANYAMNYRFVRREGPPREKYWPFLNADLLRQFVPFPGDGKANSAESTHQPD